MPKIGRIGLKTKKLKFAHETPSSQKKFSEKKVKKKFFFAKFFVFYFIGLSYVFLHEKNDATKINLLSGLELEI